MAAKIDSFPVTERLADLIGPDNVRAALFSTYTFTREFFENEVVTDLLLARAASKRPGAIPITLLLSQEHYRGHSRGYEAITYKKTLWHPKFSVLMVGTDSSPRTILILGSGNLTQSGWESNLELFMALEWSGWSLPQAIKDLLTLGAGANESRVEQWMKKQRCWSNPCPHYYIYLEVRFFSECCLFDFNYLVWNRECLYICQN